MSSRLEPMIWTVMGYWSSDPWFWLVSIDHNMDVHYQREILQTKGRCLSQPTVPSESIDPFAVFLPRGLHASLSRYSCTQLRLYLGKTEDGIRPAMTAFWTRYYPGDKDASSLSSILFPSCFFATKRA